MSSSEKCHAHHGRIVRSARGWIHVDEYHVGLRITTSGARICEKTFHLRICEERSTFFCRDTPVQKMILKIMSVRM
jgi:hypothetical protein